MRTHCTECGARLWSHEAQQRGAHPDCLDDAHDSTAADLEDRLADALGDAPQGDAP